MADLKITQTSFQGEKTMEERHSFQSHSRLWDKIYYVRKCPLEFTAQFVAETCFHNDFSIVLIYL